MPEKIDYAVVILEQGRIDFITQALVGLDILVRSLRPARGALEQPATRRLPSAVPTGQTVRQPERGFKVVDLRRP